MNPITFINQMTTKIYTVTEGFEDGKHFYDISYKRNFRDKYFEKEIRFSYIEHYLQFVDLLHEAAYTFTDEYQ